MSIFRTPPTGTGYSRSHRTLCYHRMREKLVRLSVRDRTVTEKEQLFVNSASVAEHVTEVTPIGKGDPDSGVQALLVKDPRSGIDGGANRTGTGWLWFRMSSTSAGQRSGVEASGPSTTNTGEGVVGVVLLHDTRKTASVTLRSVNQERSLTTGSRTVATSASLPGCRRRPLHGTNASSAATVRKLAADALAETNVVRLEIDRDGSCSAVSRATRGRRAPANAVAGDRRTQRAP